MTILMFVFSLCFGGLSGVLGCCRLRHCLFVQNLASSRIEGAFVVDPSPFSGP